MAFARIFSIQTVLIDAHVITVEIDVSHTGGVPYFSIVGLPDKAIEESRDRVHAAIKNSSFSKGDNFTAPKSGGQKVTVSLAPAEIRKEGPLFDLPIAIAYLSAILELPLEKHSKKIFFGELSLDGVVRPTRGVLALVQKAQAEGFKEIFVPTDNAKEYIPKI